MLNESVVIDINTISLSKSEVARRLNVPNDFDSEIFFICEKELKENAEPKYYSILLDVTAGDDEVDFGFTKIKSKNLAKNLCDCKKAYLFAVTLGHKTDRLIASAKVSSPAKAFMLDALSSAMAEACADYVSAELGKNASLKPRFSPGYGDLSLEFQKDVLYMLNADKILGVKLSDSLLMTPRKTITAIQGVTQ